MTRENIENGLVLDLGCGKSIHPEADLGVDLFSTEAANMIATLDRSHGISYLPFDDDVASTVYLRHTLEHLSDIDHIMVELCRVVEPGGRIHVRVPYYNSLNAAADPTHKIAHKITEHTWTYYEDNPLAYETGDSDISIEDISYVYRQRGLLQRLLPDRIKYELRHELSNLVEELVVELRVIG